MFDLITHVPDSAAFLAEVQTKFPDKVIMSEDPMVNGKADPAFVAVPVSVSITKTPTIRKNGGLASVSVIRCTQQELTDIKTLTTVSILAEVPMGGDLLKAMSKVNRKKYDTVHDQTPVAVLDDKGKPMLDANGKALMSTPPALIGAFA